MSSANFSFFRKKMERWDLHFTHKFQHQLCQVAYFNHYLNHVWHLPVQLRIAYCYRHWFAPAFSVTFLSGKSYSPDISLCKKAGLSDLRMCLCTTAHTRLRFWVITGLVTSPDNFIIQYLSVLSMGFFRFFQNFLLPPLPLTD